MSEVLRILGGRRGQGAGRRDAFHSSGRVAKRGLVSFVEVGGWPTFVVEFV